MAQQIIACAGSGEIVYAPKGYLAYWENGPHRTEERKTNVSTNSSLNSVVPQEC